MQVPGPGRHQTQLYMQRQCAQSMLSRRGRCRSSFLLQSVFNALRLPGAGGHGATAMVAPTHLAGSEGPLNITTQERPSWCGHAKWSLAPTACEWTCGLCS